MTLLHSVTNQSERIGKEVRSRTRSPKVRGMPKQTAPWSWLICSFRGNVRLWGLFCLVVVVYRSWSVLLSYPHRFTPRILELRHNSRPTECHYYISSKGSDGVGHQMESKLSCLATALALGMTYVHQPIKTLEHGSDPFQMEELFAMPVAVSKLFDSTLAVLYNSSRMSIEKRHPLPWVGHCSEESWFDRKMREKTNECPTSSIVFEGDNCWDYFWCHTHSLPPSWKADIVPLLRKSFLEPKTSDSSVRQRKKSNTLHVTVHVRRGDAGHREANFSWIEDVLHEVIGAAMNIGIEKVEVVLHSDADHNMIEEGIQVTDNRTESFVQVSIVGRDDEGSTIDRVMRDMVTADILVASESALSNTAALLRNQPVFYPANHERSRMTHLGWSMLERPVGWNNLLRCVQPPPPKTGSKCERWDVATKEFFSKEVSKAVRQEKNRFSREILSKAIQ